MEKIVHNPNILKMIVYAVILIGVFTGLLETASASANINVADNGHYFEYEGKQVFLLGLGSWHPINTLDIDYTAHNQWYQPYGINYNRITLTSTWYTDRSKQVFPWKRSTIPGANDGGNKFDLNEWDPAFWNRLQGYLQDCEDRGIIVCIQIFDECVVEYGSQRWNQHPFNPQNNINNIPDLGTTDASYSSSTGWSKSFYNVDNSVLMTLQDIYVQKLLDETSQYGNIIYEMANEYGGEGSTQFPGHFAWPQHWIDFFSNYEAAGVQLLLTNMPFGGSYNQAEYFAASGIDCIDAYRQFPSYSDVQGVNDFLGSHYNKGKPIFAGKIGNDVGPAGGNLNDNRQRLWTLFVSGSAGSGLKGSGGHGVAGWSRTDDTTMEEMLFNIHNFIESGVQFWNMSPSDSLVTSGSAYCLANVGQEYIIYLPDGGSVTVDLSEATGTLDVEWYDPKDGTYYDEGTVTGGGSESFTPPFSDDAVLHILLSTEVNHAPVAQDQSVTTDEDTAKAITLVATDVDGDTVTYSIVTQPSYGTLSGAAPNMTYTPDANYHCSDSFTFKANDALLDSNVAAVSITVTSVNDAPVAQDQSVTTDEDTPKAITLVATDVDGDTVTYSIVTQPSYGTLIGTAPNMTYTPDTDYNGSDSFTFKANDGLLDSNVATVFIIVGSELVISNLMVASGNAYEVVDNGLVVGALQYIDRSYTFSAVPGSITGATYIKTANNDKNRAETDFLSFDVNPAVTIYVAHDDRIVPRPSWLHDFVDTGEDMLSDDPESSPFSLFNKDFPQGTLSLGGNIDSSIPADTKRSMYTVVIVGEGSNHPPVADPNGPYTGTEGVPIAYDGNGSYDPDGTIVSYLWTFGDGNNATGVTPTHIYAQDGTYNVTLTVTDNDGATDTSITTATIADTEPIADFSATPTSGQESLTVTFSDNSTSYDGIEAWNWDFDNDGVTDSNVQNPTHVYAEEGVYTVSLKANESDGDSETMTKTDYIGVTKVNKAPFTPANPSPSDGATDVPIDAVLSWTGGDPDDEDTVTYDVYFGTNTSPPKVAGNQLETTYDPGTRDNSTEYYWQIVATDEHDASNESEVWSFTTTAVPAPETIPPLVSNPSANPDVIPDDTDNDPRWGETSQINVTVTDDSGVLSVTINLSAIGGSPTQSLTSIPDTNTWTVSTNASAGTAPGIYHLKINATDTNGNSNTSVSVELRVMKNGDIDGDGTVTHDDSEYLANYLTKIPGYGEIEEVVADVDEQVDECVTIADYEYLKNHISGEPGYEKLH